MWLAILTFYKFKWSTIVSSEFLQMKLSYVSVVKTLMLFDLHPNSTIVVLVLVLFLL